MNMMNFSLNKLFFENQRPLFSHSNCLYGLTKIFFVMIVTFVVSVTFLVNATFLVIVTFLVSVTFLVIVTYLVSVTFLVIEKTPISWPFL